MSFSLKQPELNLRLSDVWILRSIDDETAFGQPRREVVVCVLQRRIDNVLHTAVHAVLADNHRTPLSGLQVLGKQKNSVSEHVSPNRQVDFIAGPLRLVVSPAGARLEEAS